MKILIVDDNANDRKILSYNLEKHGCEVIEAGDGEDGIEKIKEHMPDLIISDVLMPRLDGFQFLRKIKSDSSLKPIPFMFYSSVYTGERDMDLAKSLGAEEFIVKPLEIEELWGKMKEVLDRVASGEEIPLKTQLMYDEEEYLRKYGSVVAAKLEEKVRELEKEMNERRHADEKMTQRSQIVLRQNSTLVSLAQNKGIYEGDLKAAFTAITETSALTMDVSRVSIWYYTEGNSGIKCMDLYDLNLKNHSEGVILEASVFPGYFKAMQEGKLIVADDAVADPRTREFSESYLKPLGITSMLDVPIRVGGAVIGVVCHEHVGERRTWTIEEQSFATAIAGFAAVAIEIHERKEVEDNLYRQSTNLSTLNRIMIDVAATLELRDVLERTVKSAVELAGADGGSVALYDEALGVMTYPYHYNMPERLSAVIARKGQGLAEHVMKTGESVVIEDYPAHPRALKEYVDAGLKVLLAVPIVTKNKSFGTLGIFGLTPERRFTAQQVALIQGIGRQAAIAIENAKLFEETRLLSENLRDSEYRYRNLFDSISDGIYRTDSNSVFTMINPAGAEMFGHKSVSEMIGANVIDYWLVPSDREVLVKELKEKKGGLITYAAGRLRGRSFILRQQAGSLRIVTGISSGLRG